ncbi:MAG: restriction endonuclease [Theionarchaea archaeon]|nr:restriction endonuclease [Theionarchaea archaeon]
MKEALEANKREKGSLFERFVAQFFSMVPSFYVIENIRSNTEQFDIVIDVDPQESGGLWWSQFLPLIYVECKNRIETTGQDIISTIGGKAATHRAKLVFVVTSANISLQAFQQSCYFTALGCCIVIIKAEEIQEVISAKSDINEFLREKVRDTYLRIHP